MTTEQANKLRRFLDMLGAEEITPEGGIPLKGSWRGEYFLDEEGYFSLYLGNTFSMWELGGFAHKWITTVLLSFSF